MTQNCSICNNQFISKRKNQKFCSIECRIEHKNNVRRRKPNIFKCLICHNVFIQKRKDNLTCSPSCCQKLWIKNNPEKDWNRHNSEKAKKTQKKWIKNNHERFRNIQNKYKKIRYRNNINYKLNVLMGNAIRHGIHDKSFKKWETLVGYSINELKNFLEKRMPKNVTWDDYLNGKYHIDHIIPQSMFNFTSYKDPEFKKCWHYRNLRILHQSKNSKKLSSFNINLIKKYKIWDLLPEDFNKF